MFCNNSNTNFVGCNHLNEEKIAKEKLESNKAVLESFEQGFRNGATWIYRFGAVGAISGYVVTYGEDRTPYPGGPGIRGNGAKERAQSIAEHESWLKGFRFGLYNPLHCVANGWIENEGEK